MTKDEAITQALKALIAIRSRYETLLDSDYATLSNPDPASREPSIAQATAAIAACRAALAQPDDAQDARRYRWLRAQHEGGDSSCFAVFEPDPCSDCLQPIGSMAGELDAAIDAAIAAQGEA